MKTTLSVYECGEFHAMGKCYTQIESVAEAVKIWEQIPFNNPYGIRAIDICLQDDLGEEIEEYEAVYGNYMDLGLLPYYPGIRQDEQAMKFVEELRQMIPDLRVLGKLPDANEEVAKPRHHR